jgi:mannose-6-phosphate isomerase-like protein (cupin superfamily)
VGTRNTPHEWGPHCAKFLYLKGGYKCSLHRHAIKDETFFVLEGTVTIKYIAKNGTIVTRHYEVGEHLHIEPGTYHQFWSHSPALLLEVSTEHRESDVARLQDSAPIDLYN